MSVGPFNILDRDDAEFRFGTGSWAASAAASGIERVNLEAEGLPAHPDGIKWALKITMNGTDAAAALLAQTLTAQLYQGAGYVLVDSTWDGGDVWIYLGNFTGASHGSLMAVTPNDTTWQQASRTSTPASGDLAGFLQVQAATGSPPSSGHVIYITGMIVSRWDTLPDWNLLNYRTWNMRGIKTPAWFLDIERKATSFDAGQYGSLAVSNLLAADDAIQYASKGSWAAGGGSSTTPERVRIDDEGLPRTGLPAELRTSLHTCLKLVCDGDDLNVATLAIASLTASTQYFWSAWVLVESDWDGGDVEVTHGSYGGGSGNSETLVTPSALSWRRAYGTLTLGADVDGFMTVRAESGSPATNGKVIYVAAAQVEAASALGDFDMNALFSPGDQDWLINAWVKGDDIEGGVDFQTIFRRWNTAGTFEILMDARGVGTAPAEFDMRVTHDGTTQKTITTTGDKATSGVWHNVSLYHESGVGLGLIIDGLAVQTTAHTTGVVQKVIETRISSVSGGSWDGALGPITFCAEAAGMTDSFQAIHDYLRNSGVGRSYHQISTAKKASMGLVEAFDLSDSLTGQHAGIALTNNGTLDPGDVDGPPYRIGTHGPPDLSFACLPRLTSLDGGGAKVDPFLARTTVGDLDFAVLDEGGDFSREAVNGLDGKTGIFYAGAVELVVEDYQPLLTGTFRSLKGEPGIVRGKLGSPNQYLNRPICNGVQTRLLAPGISMADMSCNIPESGAASMDSSGFLEMEEERIAYSSIAAGVVTFSERGALGTSPSAHAPGVAVREIFRYTGTPTAVREAIMTNTDKSGASMPSALADHSGISGDYSGYTLELVVDKEVKVLELIATELDIPLGWYPTLGGDGVVGARPFTRNTSAAAVASLDETNIVAFNGWSLDPSRAINRVQVKYDFDPFQEDADLAYRTSVQKQDTDAQGKRGVLLSVIRARAFHSKYQGTRSLAGQRARARLRRLARGAMVCRFTAFIDTHTISPGSEVLVTHPEVPNRETGDLGVTDVPMEVFSIRSDFGRGFVALDLLYLDEDAVRVIGSSGMNDYLSATAAELEVNAWIGASGTNLLPDGSPGYEVG